MLLKKAPFFFAIFFCSFLCAQQVSKNQLLDSVNHYRVLSTNDSYELDQRVNFIKKAIVFSEKTNQDSTILKSKRKLATLYLRQFAVDSLFDLNHQNLKLAKKLKDTLALAYINNVLGWYHKVKYQTDSSYTYYYNASKYFDARNMVQNQADALMEMANIQFEERDYVGCESNAFKAIRLYQTMPKDDYTLGNLWGLFNLVAIAADELKQYDKAIEYHNKALSFSNKIKDNFLYTLYSKSNIALIYKELNQFDKSLAIYEELFQNEKVLQQEPANYALILGDYALLKHKNAGSNSADIKRMLHEAYRISDSLDDELSRMSVALNASEFYLDEGVMDTALNYANIAYTRGKESLINDVTLNALLLKSKIESPEKSVNYLNEYIHLNDSLVNKERAIRNKFARIEFETEQVELENQQISRERLWLMILSAGLIITFILVYIIVTQRAKNKELKLVQQQQEANEEIYNLMLSQQDKVDEARSNEKKRISQDLHDGILGRLFGTRLSLDSLNMISTDEAIQTRENYIQELKTIEQDIRDVSHELNTDFISKSGYPDIIESLIEAQTKAHGLTYSLYSDSDISWEDISNKTKIHIYRMLQESLQNIFKHAEANRVDISFNMKKNVIWLQIADDGSGFDSQKAKKGIGLKNMHSRVSEFDGELDIASKKDNGTTITIKIPI
ncbi:MULTISPECIES: ATP-binding protein [Bizionia]|uniref:Oxygen sensor histidine kinase NreB n=1 Tax=Bizionia algoritergicola TaxID=291187 RepID=A0A5D0R219_9FLAO|nr:MULTISPECIES: sensor histidine kinase [Bizionia]OBX23088.1 two-component sensor histidine kinase [Bizionia sp. APA-3]TYB74748.1 tetratricopeptide repeat protein [Bizionia algoritergicola]